MTVFGMPFQRGWQAAVFLPSPHLLSSLFVRGKIAISYHRDEEKMDGYMGRPIAMTPLEFAHDFLSSPSSH
ncbi:hypothetical protein COLO4_12047 [Corchorus olitorius]|uniref:Uncharacterized protein n=1 Tax=Corchorus olitorius TaxID=93759 RepID=A0A1R3K2C3_9ROSI|nr:hypothetical protein COLO4_12047 [Corchorus olitorius]